jgi:maltose/maltodextrin transport system substrate-binding protein
MVAYRNRSSPNRDLVEEFLEHYLLTDEGLSAMNDTKPIGVPALISLYDRMAQDNPLLRQLEVSVDQGRIMPNIPPDGLFFHRRRNSPSNRYRRSLFGGGRAMAGRDRYATRLM